MNPLWLKIIYFVGAFVTVVIRHPHTQVAKTAAVTTAHKTTQEKLLLGGVFFGMMILPLLYIFTPLLNFANYDLPQWAQLLGIVLYAAMIYLFWRSHHDLGRNWSPTLEIREHHTLVTHGIYKSIRHPMYTSIWLWVLAQPLLLNNWIAGLSGIVAFGFMYILRVPQEEKMMLDQFGDEYRAYQQRTGKIWPKWF